MNAKKWFFIIITLLETLCLLGCASTGTPRRAAMDYAGSVNFYFEPHTQTENLCVILTKNYAFIRTIDGLPLTDWVISPGIHHLVVQYQFSGPTYGSNSEPVSMVFSFESGKYYYLDYEITGKSTVSASDTIQFSITELTDPALIQKADNAIALVKSGLEKQEPYLVFSDTNPAHLEGTWEFNAFTLTFNEGRYRIGIKLFGRENARTSEGRYFFDDQTIVALVENETGVGAYERLKKVWYYELKDGVLEIKVQGDENYLANGKYLKSN
ncbi:MAG: hypothetical protein LBK64_04905 [Spirochaetaceae bacterium]|jgi:hypothetical protein|nr:hypothetical protein [Spirochaetaceae bacterium]